MPAFWGTGTWHATGGDVNGTTGKVACGDTILLRGGQTYTGTQGGAWCIAGANSGSGNSDDCTNVGKLYYANNCTGANPITIRVATAAEWTSGVGGCTATSGGNFVYNGNGILPVSTQFNCSGSGGGICSAVMIANGANGIVFGGADDMHRFEITNSPIRGANKSYTVAVHSPTTTEVGIVTDENLQWLYVHDAVRAISLAGAKNSILKDTVVDHIAHACVSVGWAGSNTNVHNVGLVRVTARRCGSRGDVNGGSEIGTGFADEEDSIMGIVGYRIWTQDCSAIDDEGRAWNFGGHPRASCGFGPMSSHHRNFRAIDTGLAACQAGKPGCTPGSLTPGLSCTGSGQPWPCCTGAGRGPQCRPTDSGVVNSGSGSDGDAAGLCSNDCLAHCNSDGDCSGGTCYFGKNAPGGLCGGTYTLNACNTITVPLHAYHFFLGGIMFKNLTKNTMIYGSSRMEVWNADLFGGAWSNGPSCGSSCLGAGDIVYDRNAMQLRMFNSIVQKRSYGGSPWYGPQSSNVPNLPNAPLTGNNLFNYASSPSEVLSAFSCPSANCGGASVTFANGGTTSFLSATDLVNGAGAATHPVNFTSIPPATCDHDPRGTQGAVGDYGTCSGGATPGESCAFDHDCPGGGTCSVNCNFTPVSGSAAIDAGRCYMKTANGGTSATGPVLVTTNDGTLVPLGGSPASAGTVRTNAGGSYNPNDYFMDANTFLGASPDTVEIGGTVVGLASTALTEATCSGCSGGNFPTGCSNGTVCHYAEDCIGGTCGGGSLTVATPISWINGACVHLRYAGAAPDVGAFESGATSTTPAAPTLLSVQPVP